MKIKFAILAVLASVSFSAHADVPTPNDPDYCQRIGRLSIDLKNNAKTYGLSVDDFYKNIRAGAVRNGLEEQTIANFDMAHEYLGESMKPGETRTPSQICQEDTDIMNSIQPYDPDKKE